MDPVKLNIGGLPDLPIHPEGVPAKVILGKTGQASGVCAAAKNPNRNHKANERKRRTKVLKRFAAAAVRAGERPEEFKAAAY